MRAVVVTEPGDASKLEIGTVPKPVPGPNELLVKVHSFGKNYKSNQLLKGGYPAPFGASQILGVEFAGTVEQLNPIQSSTADEYKVGDRVFGLVYGGAYAEYLTINTRMLMRIPSSMTFQEATAMPEVFFTAYQALHFNCALKEGDDVLIHAGASGVGTAAIQLAKLAGARNIFTTSSTTPKLTFCESLGATKSINYKTNSFTTVIKEHTSGKGVDVLIDVVGQSHWDANLDSLALDGRMVMLAFLSGAVVKETNLGLILRKRLTIKGSTLRSRALDYQIQLRDAFVEKVLPAVERGEIKPIIDTQFSWKNIREAHERLESNKSIGKIVVNID
ncbi:hypothetical protein HDV05_003882 [Chytridiales sp. JEL 0842]|nr:hypothetical protein HDV05_003882 [Chytridiales sp. JEL 0842]